VAVLTRHPDWGCAAFGGRGDLLFAENQALVEQDFQQAESSHRIGLTFFVCSYLFFSFPLPLFLFIFLRKNEYGSNLYYSPKIQLWWNKTFSKQKVHIELD
jgi:hypothetical protein